MTLGLTAALLAAAVFGAIAVVQASVLRRHGFVSPLMAVVLAGYLLGWFLHLISIDRLPLYLAQVGVGASLVVTALIAAFVMGEPLAPRHWTAVAALTFSLGLLAVASGDVGDSTFTGRTTLALYVGLAVTTVAGVVAARSTHPLSGIALGILAGVAYAGSPLATRVLTDVVWTTSALLPAATIGLYGGLGFILYSLALQRAPVTAVSAPMILLQTVLPAVAGVIAFGDQVRAGWWPVALIAFGAAVAASVVLCSAESRWDLETMAALTETLEADADAG